MATWIYHHGTRHREGWQPSVNAGTKDASGAAVVLTGGRPFLDLSTKAAVKMLRETSTLMIVQIKSFPKEENIKLLKEYVSVQADVNYMHIPDKKTTEGRVHEVCYRVSR